MQLLLSECGTSYIIVMGWVAGLLPLQNQCLCHPGLLVHFADTCQKPSKPPRKHVISSQLTQALAL
jgi:hypothetical protein